MPPSSIQADPGPLCPSGEKPIVCTICCGTRAHKGGDKGKGLKLMFPACLILFEVRTMWLESPWLLMNILIAIVVQGYWRGEAASVLNKY